MPNGAVVASDLSLLNQGLKPGIVMPISSNFSPLLIASLSSFSSFGKHIIRAKCPPSPGKIPYFM